MFRLFRKNDDPPPRRWFFGGQTSLSARLAWLVLVLAVTFVILRMSIATIVSVHGDGMAPTILDGDHVLMIRGTWGLQRGDVLVYQPRDTTTTYYAERAEQPNELESALLDASIVNIDDPELQETWQNLQTSEAPPDSSPSVFRLARILAVPGDRVTFNDPRGVLGLVINGEPLTQKPGPMVRLQLPISPLFSSNNEDARHPTTCSSAYEFAKERRYQVLKSLKQEAPKWPGLHLPNEIGPVEMKAEGYLVVADYRDEGICCDSRALGWIMDAQIRGEVILRLGGNSQALPDIPAESRTLRWYP